MVDLNPKMVIGFDMLESAAPTGLAFRGRTHWLSSPMTYLGGGACPYSVRAAIPWIHISDSTVWMAVEVFFWVPH
jgi:hypothetical protein